MPSGNNTYRPLIIIGSPRSGTNMLRDILSGLPSMGTWPCDEINYIWRHGNTRYPSDEFITSMAYPKVAGFIREQFDQQARKNGKEWLVEKTCANSVRVDFVDAVIPDARYLFIYRDGYDVIGSAMKRWKAGLDARYLLAKARYVPLGDLPYYFSRYLFSHLHRLVSSEQRQAFWGPRLSDMDELLKNFTLEEVCALQWRHCVTSAENSFSQMPDSKVFRIRYEDFVGDSSNELARICEYLGLSISTLEIQSAVKNVSASSVGKGRRELDCDAKLRIDSLIGEVQKIYGYS